MRGVTTLFTAALVQSISVQCSLIPLHTASNDDANDAASLHNEAALKLVGEDFCESQSLRKICSRISAINAFVFTRAVDSEIREKVRERIRRTASDEVSIFFPIGISTAEGLSENEVDSIRSECKRNRNSGTDLLIGDFVDSYGNLSVKTVFSISVFQACAPTPALFIKMDHDAIVNWSVLERDLQAFTNGTRKLVSHPFPSASAADPTSFAPSPSDIRHQEGYDIGADPVVIGYIWDKMHMITADPSNKNYQAFDDAVLEADDEDEDEDEVEGSDRAKGRGANVSHFYKPYPSGPFYILNDEASSLFLDNLRSLWLSEAARGFESWEGKENSTSDSAPAVEAGEAGAFRTFLTRRFRNEDTMVGAVLTLQPQSLRGAEGTSLGLVHRREIVPVPADGWIQTACLPDPPEHGQANAEDQEDAHTETRAKLTDIADCPCDRWWSVYTNGSLNRLKSALAAAQECSDLLRIRKLASIH